MVSSQKQTVKYLWKNPNQMTKQGRWAAKGEQFALLTGGTAETSEEIKQPTEWKAVLWLLPAHSLTGDAGNGLGWALSQFLKENDSAYRSCHTTVRI